MANQGVEITVKFDKRGVELWERLMESVSPQQNRRLFDRILTQGAVKMADLASEKFIVHGRGRHAPVLPRQLTLRTGTLSRSISHDFTQLPRISKVGTALEYGRVHELGKRPFLKPAAQDLAKNHLQSIMIRVMESEIARA